MTREIALVAVVALLVTGTSAALAVSSGPTATSDPVLAQETTTGNETAETENETTETETTTAEGMVGADTARVTFLNQSAGFTFTEEGPDETTVLIERVVVPEGGFVAIHRATNVTGVYATEGNVSIGPVVGNSTYLEPGVHSNVVVELNESINTTQTLIAMPHRDTNDNRQYDFPGADEPYTRNGSPVIDTAYVIVRYDVIEGIGGQTNVPGEEQTTTANGTTTA